MANEYGQKPPTSATPGNPPTQTAFEAARRSNGAVPQSDPPPPSNIPVAESVIEPEIPWIDLRRFHQLVWADRLERELTNVKGEERDAPIYPFTTGIQLTNDGVGFGEEIVESRVPSGSGKPEKVAPQELRFRRTRSGKVPFRETDTFFLSPQGRDDT